MVSQMVFEWELQRDWRRESWWVLQLDLSLGCRWESLLGLWLGQLLEFWLELEWECEWGSAFLPHSKILATGEK